MKTRKGFTLVEILIVIVVLSILAWIVIPQFFEKELEYSRVVADMRSNYYIKMEHTSQNEEICLIKENYSRKILTLNKSYFFILKRVLEKGGELGTWTFEPDENTKISGELEYTKWIGTRIQEQKEDI